METYYMFIIHTHAYMYRRRYLWRKICFVSMITQECIKLKANKLLLL